jgi:hypothetical protein
MAAAAEMALGQELHAVAAMGLEHVALQQRVVRHAAPRRMPWLASTWMWHFAFCATLGAAGILQPGPQAPEHFGQRQLAPASGPACASGT